MPEKDELKFNSDDIPYILNNMTETPEETDYLAPETTAPNGFYDPTKETPNTIPGYDPITSAPPSEYVPEVPQPPSHPNSENAHNELLENPKYAVHVHETQINRIVEVLENISDQINHLENRLGDLEQSVRFSNDHSPQDGPPTPPSGTDYGT
tara:strand:- start:535 stop:993 length:459 start_codon:yes stop_codon:yes gene_type:complete